MPGKMAMSAEGFAAWVNKFKQTVWGIGEITNVSIAKYQNEEIANV